MIYFFVFLFGLIVGSFLNCLIYRLESNKSFLFGRSFCPHCQHILSWSDLVPLLSFLILKGKCRYCQKKISWQYPLVELATGLLFSLPFILTYFTYDRLPFMSSLIFYWIMSGFLIVIFVYDLKHYLIPDKIINPAIVLAFFYNVFHSIFIVRNFKPFLESLGSAVGAGIFFLTFVLISRGKWMGEGDIKLAFLMGLILGWPKILISLFLAFFIGAIIGIGLIILAKKTLKSEIPFGPFLATGTFLAMFFGEKLIALFFNFLL